MNKAPCWTYASISFVQDRYVGDAGDFGKYGLLRALCASADIRLGVVWHLVPNENRTDDGKHTRYLKRSTQNNRFFRNCNSELYDALADIVVSGNRRVARIQKDGILPKGTEFYDESLSFADVPLTERRPHRARWLSAALDATVNCNLIFVDPDNGLSYNPATNAYRSVKFALIAELKKFAERGQSLVIYQHANHSKPARQQLANHLEELARHLRPQMPTFRRACTTRGTCRHVSHFLAQVDSRSVSSWSRQKVFALDPGLGILTSL